MFKVTSVSEEFITNPHAIFDNCGTISDKDMFFIITSADKLKMKCLNFIDDVQDTIFNYYQGEQIKQEIDILRSYPGISQEALDVIQRGINQFSNEEECVLLKFHKAGI